MDPIVFWILICLGILLFIGFLGYKFVITYMKSASTYGGGKRRKRRNSRKKKRTIS
jgi:hypothetical protein